MKTIPNDCLHFGDFDMAGTGFHPNEYKRHIPQKSRFFIPEGLDKLIKVSGSRERYDLQKINFDDTSKKEKNILKLIELLHKYKKGMDQESLIVEE